MDTDTPHTPIDPTSLQWSAQMARTIAAERRRLREFADAQRAKIDQLRATVLEHLEHLAVEDGTREPRSVEPRPRSEAPDLSRIDALLRETRDSAARKVSERDEQHSAIAQAQVDSRRDEKPAKEDKSAKLDWEAQKRQMIAALESGGEVPSFEAPLPEEVDGEDERLTIEGAIGITDDVIAEKDRMIAELQRRLDEQTSAAVKAPTTDELLGESSDPVVQQERERALQLQNELQEKLRVGEMELSRERAQLARTKVQLDQQRRDLDEQRSTMEKEVVVNTNSDATAKKQPRGRWLARLGLKDNGDESSKS
ncbi:MAG: hypothetical protein JSS27_01695 [Planctomycetes bacterium]|nr:hypothetical protein [Planctomycetota bacterium]